MRHVILGTFAFLLVGVGLASAQSDDAPKKEPEPAATPKKSADPVAAPKPAGEPLGLPKPVGPVGDAVPPVTEGHHPTFEPAVTAWTRLPPEDRCGPPPGICPNDPCACLPLPERLWFRTDLLIWWLRNDRIEPVVTTGPAIIPPGVLGGTNTAGVGAGRVDHGAFTGVRFTAGGWVDEGRLVGFEGSYFVLGEQVKETFRNTARDRVLARPFFNLNTGTPSSLVISFPGVLTGAVQLRSPTDLDGFELNARLNYWSCRYDRLDALAGIRYLNLDEELRVAATAVSVTGPSLATLDVFRTRNEFYGGQLGADLELQRDCWFITFRGKVALGETHEMLDIAGGQLLSVNGASIPFAGGVLAQTSNIGHFSKDRFSVVPEAALELGYQVMKHVRLTLGYSFLYWNGIIRPGQQPDFMVDVSQNPNLAGPAAPTGQRRPMPLFRETDLWVQGINIGAEIRY